MDLTGPGDTGNLKSEPIDSLLSLLISFEKTRSEADPSASLLIMSSFELSINLDTGCLQAEFDYTLHDLLTSAAVVSSSKNAQRPLGIASLTEHLPCLDI